MSATGVALLLRAMGLDPQKLVEEAQKQVTEVIGHAENATKRVEALEVLYMRIDAKLDKILFIISSIEHDNIPEDVFPEKDAPILQLNITHVNGA